MPQRLDVLDLFRCATHEALATLIELGVIRGTAPKQVAGDYAEYLVASLLGGELARRGNPGFDVLLPDRTRVSVKSRNLGVQYYRHISVRRATERDFDQLVLVEFRPDWTIAEAREILWDEIASVRDYVYTRPTDGRVYDRFYRTGKWRTAARPIPLAAEQERLRRT
jgi:hypothetical protein